MNQKLSRMAQAEVEAEQKGREVMERMEVGSGGRRGVWACEGRGSVGMWGEEGECGCVSEGMGVWVCEGRGM